MTRTNITLTIIGAAAAVAIAIVYPFGEPPDDDTRRWLGMETSEVKHADDCPPGYECGVIENFEWPASETELSSDAVPNEVIAANALQPGKSYFVNLTGDSYTGGVCEQDAERHALWDAATTRQLTADELLKALAEGPYLNHPQCVAYYADGFDTELIEILTVQAQQLLHPSGHDIRPMLDARRLTVTANVTAISGSVTACMADSCVEAEEDDISEPGGGLVYFTTTESSSQ